MQLKKDDIAAKVAESQDISVNAAKKQVDAVLAGIGDCLADIATAEPNEKGVRGKLSIVGFGNFEVKHKEGKAYRNPQTGEMTEPKPDANVPTFKPGKFLKDIVN